MEFYKLNKNNQTITTKLNLNKNFKLLSQEMINIIPKKNELDLLDKMTQCYVELFSTDPESAEKNLLYLKSFLYYKLFLLLDNETENNIIKIFEFVVNLCL